jgi:GNAT superfamily N-acetyltransferase
VEYEIDDDAHRIDLDVVGRFLTTEAYWHRWRTPEVVALQVRSAWRVIGAYERASGRQVGFARAVSDGVSDAYLADVFVLAEHRGRGLGKRIVAAMVDDGPGRDFRWFLSTRDAHELYRPFGFGPPSDRVMERGSRLG